MDIDIYLPWPPTVNNYYGSRMVGKRKIPFIKKAGVKFRQDVITCIDDQLNGLVDNRIFPIEEKIRVGIVMYPPDRRKRDLDNYKKALFDAITASGVWVDDSLIDQDYTFRGEVVEEGAVLVRITEGGPILPYSVGLNSDITGF